MSNSMIDALEPCPDCGSSNHKSCQNTSKTATPVETASHGRSLDELWELNFCGHQNMFIYATAGAPGGLHCAMCKVQELESQLTQVQKELNIKKEQVDEAIRVLSELRKISSCPEGKRITQHIKEKYE